VPSHAEGGVLFDEELTFAELSRRFEAGAQLVEVPAATDGLTPLFVVSAAGELSVVTAGRRLRPAPGDMTICLTGGAK
jgi:predicted amidohydrolase